MNIKDKQTINLAPEVLELLIRAQRSMHIQLMTRGGPQHMSICKRDIEKLLDQLGHDYAKGQIND